jgi:hypothetical protein
MDNRKECGDCNLGKGIDTLVINLGKGIDTLVINLSENGK